jgi:hypothetical protein
MISFSDASYNVLILTTIKFSTVYNQTNHNLEACHNKEKMVKGKTSKTTYYVKTIIGSI